MEISERIRLVINSQNLTAAAFADKLGVQRSNVSHVLAGRNKPSFEFLEKLITAFPSVSVAWLVTGETKPITETLTQTEKPLEKILKVDSKTNSKKVVKIMIFYDDFSIETFDKSES